VTEKEKHPPQKPLGTEPAKHPEHAPQKQQTYNWDGSKIENEPEPKSQPKTKKRGDF
jgi:hypothetical protein